MSKQLNKQSTAKEQDLKRSGPSKKDASQRPPRKVELAKARSREAQSVQREANYSPKAKRAMLANVLPKATAAEIRELAKTVSIEDHPLDPDRATVTWAEPVLKLNDWCNGRVASDTQARRELFADLNKRHAGVTSFRFEAVKVEPRQYIAFTPPKIYWELADLAS
jgi:hypothetical protein